MNAYVHFFIISRSVLLRVKSVSDYSCRRNQNTFCSQYLFFKKKKGRVIYETMWNTVQPDRRQVTIQCMRIACWIPKATNTNSEYVIITAFPLQQRLH